MNIMQLQILLDAMESHSIHKAAEKHNISPQGASKAIQSLENELGVNLIERSTKGVSMSDSCEDIRCYLEQIVNSYLELEKILEKQNKGKKSERIEGNLRLAVTARFVDTYLGALVEGIKKKYPGIKIEVDSMNNNDVFKKMCDGYEEYTAGIITISNFDPSLEQLNKFLETNRLVFKPFTTQELYMCGTRETIKKCGETYSVNDDMDEVSVASYEYGGALEKYRFNTCCQINSMAGQLGVINQYCVVGAFSDEEFKRHFSAKKHARIPFNKSVTLTYGCLFNSDDLNTSVNDCFYQYLLHMFE